MFICFKTYSYKSFYVQVSEEDIDEMFNFADKDHDGKISFLEFQLMINPPPLKLDTDEKSQEYQKKVTIVASEKKV